MHDQSAATANGAVPADRGSKQLNILVVGGGIAGLAFAIEARRKGFTDIRLIDKRPNFNDFGDSIALQASALFTMQKWPGFMERLTSTQRRPTVRFIKYDGTPITEVQVGDDKYPTIGVNRAQIHSLLHTYAVEQGVPITFNATATAYHETAHNASVTLRNGTPLEADIIVATDGVGSKSWGLMFPDKQEPISSGFAVYRASYPTSVALANDVIREEFGDAGSDAKGGLFFGANAHIVIAVTGKYTSWLLTHRDKGSARESWDDMVPIEAALACVEGWCPLVREAIKITPSRECADWKLMWRDPQPTWVSPLARVVQIGDAGHPFLPTSAYGAASALEDAYSLAACLDAARPGDASLALRVHNELRFERVTCAQKIDYQNREILHKPDWDALRRDPSLAKSVFGRPWLIKHDPEQYAYDNFAACARSVLHGDSFENTNSVPGYKWKPWTVKELLQASDRGEPIVDEGAWV